MHYKMLFRRIIKKNIVKNDSAKGAQRKGGRAATTESVGIVLISMV